MRYAPYTACEAISHTLTLYSGGLAGSVHSVNLSGCSQDRKTVNVCSISKVETVEALRKLIDYTFQWLVAQFNTRSKILVLVLVQSIVQSIVQSNKNKKH